MRKFNFLVLYFITLFNFSYAQETYLTLTSPLNGETLIIDSYYTITWSSINVNSVNIEYSVDNGFSWKAIAESISAIERQFLWKVPSILSKNLKIKIYSTTHPSIQSISENNIKLAQLNNPKKNNYRVFKANSKTSTVSLLRIMPLGNSITRGVIGSSNNTGYRRDLYWKLVNSGFQTSFVGSKVDGVPLDFDRDHEGHGGWSASSASNKSKSLVDSVYKFLAQNPPNIILLHIGTNDIGRLQVENQNIYNVVTEIEAILDSIDLFEQNSSSQIQVLLAKIINPIDDPSTSNVREDDTTRAFNIVLETMVNNRIAAGDKIVIVDQESALNYPNDLSDGVHPNEIGYEKMSETWYNSLMQILPIIDNNPVAKGVLPGGAVSFQILAHSSTPLSYQWQKDSVNIIGANDSQYSLQNVMLSDSGTFYRCIVSNNYGELISKEAELYVTPLDSRVKGGGIVLYKFDEGSGNSIYDVSNLGSPLNLTINTPGSVNWIQGGIEIVSAATISSISPGTKISAFCSNTNEITIEAWISTAYENQVGPSRIITMSNDISNRNFSLLQNGNVFTVALRTSTTNNNGEPTLSTLPQSFCNTILHIVYTKNADGIAKIFINGNEINSLGGLGDFSNWDSSYYFGFANEFIDSRPWLGNYFLTSIYSRALSTSEIAHNYSLGLPGITNLIPPSDLSIMANSTTSINLHWQDNSTNEAGFLIERSESNDSAYVNIDTVSFNITDYSDLSVADGTTYFYRIRAYNNIIESDPSNEDVVTLVLPAPDNLTAVLNSQDEVNLSWSDNSNSEKTFIIEGKPAHPDSSYIVLGSVSKNITSYSDVSPKYYSPYMYRIFGASQDTMSDFSNVVSLAVVDVLKDELELPKEYVLNQNFPNPFNPTTVFKYSLPFDSKISMKIYNLLGEHIITIVNDTQNAGNYFLQFDAHNFSSGVYYCNFVAKSVVGNDTYLKTIKLIIMK